MFANDTVDRNCEKLRTQVPADNSGTIDETITVLHKRKPEDEAICHPSRDRLRWQRSRPLLLIRTEALDSSSHTEGVVYKP